MAHAENERRNGRHGLDAWGGLMACMLALLLAIAPAAWAQFETEMERKLDEFVRGTLRSDNPLVLAADGANLTPQQVAVMETRLLENPNDLASRARLLGYYFANEGRNPSLRRARFAHIYWLIRNQGGSELAASRYVAIDPRENLDAWQKARDMWLAQVQANPRNTGILRNAGDFLIEESPDEAEAIYTQGGRVEPANAMWPARLGMLFTLQSSKREGLEKERLQQRALEAYGGAVRLARREERVGLLAEATRAALAAGNTDRARQYAQQIGVAAAEGDGELLHLAHTLLGIVALRSGNPDEAVTQLMRSARVPVTGRMAAEGPSMELAWMLAQAGRREAVVQYLRACRDLWPEGTGRLQAWEATIIAGSIPEVWPANR